MTREERKDAIDIIQSILDKYEEDECLATEITIGDEDIKAFNLAIKALEQELRWIPVSERLPENNGDYLVTIKSSDGTAIITFQMVDHFGPGWLHEEKTRKIIAWMPLPKEYGEVEE